MLLALSAFIYNELNNKFRWNMKELDVSLFAILDYILIMVIGIILYIIYEVLPALRI